MKSLNILFFASLLILTLQQEVLFAQFEGEIQFEMREQADESSPKKEMRFVFTNDRIYIDSNVSLNVMSGLSTNGILVRNDMKDFILMTGNNEAIQIAKSEIESVMTMFDRLQGRSNVQPKPFAWDERVYETGESQIIHGYTTHQYIMREENDDNYISVWLTNEIKVNWGLLHESWYSTGQSRFENEIPIEMVMNHTSFPLLVEVFKNDVVKFSARSTSIDSRNFERSKTELPSGLKLIEFSEIMMNFFRQQR